MTRSRPGASDRLNTAPWIGWLEPITPVFLAVHGALILTDSESTPAQWALVGVTALLGLAGLAGWRAASAVTVRAWLLLALTWLLLFLSGGIAAFFTLWFFMLTAVYPLVLGGKVSVAYPIVIGLAYLGLAPLADSQLPPAVLFGRVAVITAIGLVVAGISNAQRQASDELVRTKDEFVAAVSHELRTPLTAVVGFSAVLQQHAHELLPAEVGEHAGAVYRHAVEVADIVEDLLVAARANVGQVSVRPVVLDIRDELDNVLADLAPLIGSDNDRLLISGPSTLASADPTRVRQILRNLVVNAFRHGGTQIEATVTTRSDQIRIEVADNGIGIPDTDVTRLFTPYQRFHEDSGQPNSIGLGLAVSKILAQLMGGDLSYHRRDGWTVFRLELPAVEPVANTV